LLRFPRESSAISTRGTSRALGSRRVKTSRSDDGAERVTRTAGRPRSSWRSFTR
jgi:hypothetical protein